MITSCCAKSSTALLRKKIRPFLKPTAKSTTAHAADEGGKSTKDAWPEGVCGWGGGGRKTLPCCTLASQDIGDAWWPCELLGLHDMTAPWHWSATLSGRTDHYLLCAVIDVSGVSFWSSFQCQVNYYICDTQGVLDTIISDRRCTSVCDVRPSLSMWCKTLRAVRGE